MNENLLPRQFNDLEIWHDWSLATELERSAKRQASTMEDIRRFYDAMLPRMEDILTFLAQYPLDGNPPEVARLSLLTLSLAEIAPAVENFGQPSVVDGYDVARFKPVEIYARDRGV